MPRYDKPFTEEEIGLIYECVEAARNNAEREGNEDDLTKLDELCEKLGY